MAAVSVVSTVNTNHEDMIHDAQMDYYGKKLATCSSDRTIKVYEVAGSSQKLVANLRGHEGPVWQIAWAHPKFGNILASCSYDRKVIVWKESGNEYVRVYESAHHDSSVNSVSWAPHEYGLLLACGASDGAVSVISGDGKWEVKQKIANAHPVGCNAVSWAPANDTTDNKEPATTSKRFVSGGCDSLVKVWAFRDSETSAGCWVEEDTLDAHSDWVRDVAWAPNIGIDTSMIASCSMDHKVIIWRRDNSKGEPWTSHILHTFNDVVWHVSWSITGNILAVSGGDNKVSLWKETLDGQWVCVSDVDKGQGTEPQR